MLDTKNLDLVVVKVDFHFNGLVVDKWGGRFGLSINKDGNSLSAISYYNKKYFGKEKNKIK